MKHALFIFGSLTLLFFLLFGCTFNNYNYSSPNQSSTKEVVYIEKPALTEPTPTNTPPPEPLNVDPSTVNNTSSVETTPADPFIPPLPRPDSENISLIVPPSSPTVSVATNTSPSENITSPSTNTSATVNASINTSGRFRIPIPIIDVNPTLATPTVYGPGIYYFNPGSGGFIIEIDGIVTSIFDDVGVVLRVGESANPNDPVSFFKGDYPTHSPRDIIIKSRVIRNRDLSNWRENSFGPSHGALIRKSMSVVILDSERNQIRRFNYRNVWPSRYEIAVIPESFEEKITLVSESVREDS